MKTQICDLINGSKNVIRDLSASKYAGCPAGTSAEFAGTTIRERAEAAEAVKLENPETLRINVRGVELVLQADGHEFWTREGHVFKAFDYSDAQTLFGDNYETFTNSGVYWEFMREALPELISRCEDPKDAEKLAKQVRETAEAIDDMDDGDVALCENENG